MKRLGQALFGDSPGCLKGEAVQPTARERLLAQASRLRELADRGMTPRKFRREAARLESEAELVLLRIVPCTCTEETMGNCAKRCTAFPHPRPDHPSGDEEHTDQ